LSQTRFSAHYLPLWIGGEIRGRVRTDLIDRVTALPEITSVESGLRLRDDDLDVRGRSTALQSVAVQLRKLGLIADWRNELCAVLDTHGEELARCERGLFRTLGLQNRAVHINGIRTDGRVWVSRRSELKRADPGKLDTLAAGGVLAGESFRRCAIRELWEEAGVPRDLARKIDFPGVIIRSLREATFGIHDQQVIVADLVLDERFEPVGRDGEVQEFLCLEANAVRAALDGGEFTVEATLATRECLERRGL
jgi:8-oxo-dGTP pyrophosphatase MutT (NUDIX family)